MVVEVYQWIVRTASNPSEMIWSDRDYCPLRGRSRLSPHWVEGTRVLADPKSAEPLALGKEGIQNLEERERHILAKFMRPFIEQTLL